MDELAGAVRRGARRTTRSARRRVPSPASPPGSTRSGGHTGACRGRGSSSPRCGSPVRASRCRRRTPSCLAMLEPVMTMREGARIYAPGGPLLEEGDVLRAAGSRRGARARARRGRRVGLPRVDRRRARSTLVEERDGAITAGRPGRLRGRLGRRRSRRRSPAAASLTRAGLSGVPETLARLPTRGRRPSHCSPRSTRSASGRRAHDEHHGRRRGRVAPAC